MLSGQNTLLPKLHTYVQHFNDFDNELYPQLILNSATESFMTKEIPLFECPDPVIEQTYYFRWWTYRKHIKQTEKGHVITEFLPPVPWAGPHNTIVCPAGFHIREGRWLKDAQGWLKEYMDFWMNSCGNEFSYSSWLPCAIWEYCKVKNDFSFGVERLPQLIHFFQQRESKHLRSCGLYWSNDIRDGMEYSISGSGLRPTINAYACADATAIANFARIAGDTAIADCFTQKAENIRQKMNALLWDKDHYKTIPLEETDDPDLDTRPDISPDRNVRELIGFIPWYFSIPKHDQATAFAQLVDTSGFFAPHGLTTAEQRHPRFLEPHNHECLWNGEVWPFATSQTLVALSNLLHSYDQNVIGKDSYYQLLKQYAANHQRIKEDGSTVPWIDENMHPYTGTWLARSRLESWDWKQKLGGYERGKDYNHSLFCDLVLSGLLGIDVSEGVLTVNPLIPDDWTYFRIENLHANNKCFCITYDKDGSHYGIGSGLMIQQT